MNARHNLWGLATALLLAGSALGTAAADTPAPAAWSNLQRLYYGDRNIDIAEQSALVLETPATTPDPSATPLTIRFGEAMVGHIKQVRVIIDNNPSPVASTMRSRPGARMEEIEHACARSTAITSVRAMAETSRRRAGNAQHLGQCERRLLGAAERNAQR